MEWLTFSTNNRELGIEAQFLHRVVDDVRITPVPMTPPCHMGIIYYRGELFDVVHLGALLSDSPATAQSLKAYQWIILTKWSGKKLALVPDHIIGLLWLDDTEEDNRIFSQKDRTVMRITPEELWQKLMELSYGFKQI